MTLLERLKDLGACEEGTQLVEKHLDVLEPLYQRIRTGKVEFPEIRRAVPPELREYLLWALGFLIPWEAVKGPVSDLRSRFGLEITGEHVAGKSFRAIEAYSVDFRRSYLSRMQVEDCSLRSFVQIGGSTVRDLRFRETTAEQFLIQRVQWFQGGIETLNAKALVVRFSDISRVTFKGIEVSHFFVTH
ncbi:MAG: hypothetical protein D6812_07205, partial [Deltaproteobacteria bacterium]